MYNVITSWSAYPHNYTSTEDNTSSEGTNTGPYNPKLTDLRIIIIKFQYKQEQNANISQT